MNDVADREAIRRAVTHISHDIDHKRWSELRALFAEEVEVDYTSLFGGSVRRVSGDDLIGGWKTALATVTTHHLLGPIDVTLTGATARAECHVSGVHYAAGAPGGEEWTVIGHYVITLAKQGDAWRITGMTLEATHQMGNRKLLEEAAAKK